MLRRTSLIMMVFVVLFYPATAIAATNGADAEDTNSVNAEDEADSDEAEAESEEAEATEEDDEDGSEEAEEEDGSEGSEGTEEDDDGTEDSEENNEEDGGSEDATEEDDVEDGSEDATTEDDSEEASESNEDGNNEEEGSEESEEATEEETDDGSAEATAENEEGTEDDDDFATYDDELNLNDILGTANGDIVFDDENGYYVLELQAGLSNYDSSQDINEKWVAFAIPPGVEIPDVPDVPGGIYSVTLDNGNNGIAVSIPNIQEIGNETIYLDIPLIGDPDLAAPDLNLSLFDIDVGEDNVDSIGEIGSQRDIDFSVMEGDPDDPEDDPDDPEFPELNVDASVNGAVSEFDSDERHYDLNLNVDAANNMEEDLDGLYTGFALPEGVAVVDQELPEGVDILDDEDTPVLAFELPGMGAGDEGELDYTVPVIGQTEDSVSDAQLHAYAVEEGQYVPLGEIDGTANVDFSEMTEEWGFDALSQIVTGIPGLSGDEFGMNFGFDVQNITLDDVDSVNVEFDVPDAITVYEPDEYIEGDVPGELPDDWDPTDESTGESLDIEWDGNTASINLETLQGSEWNQGFFTAFGESSEALEDLEGMDVTVTLLRDGDEEVMEINVPFEVVPYGGEDPDPSPDPDPDEDDNGNGGDGDGEDNGGDSGNGNGGSNGGDGNGTEDGDKDTDDDQTSGSGDSDEEQQGGEFPDTAGETPLMMLIGTLIAVAGTVLLAFRKKLFMTN